MSHRNSIDSHGALQPAHLLSARSIAQNRDIFYFLSSKGLFQMRGGLDSRRHKLTISTFYRWLKLLDEDEDPFDLFHIKITRTNVIRYKFERASEPLPQSSTELLTPGDYAPFFKDGDEYVSKAVGPWCHSASFLLKDRQYRKRVEGSNIGDGQLRHNKLGPEIFKPVQDRDGGRCCITGLSDTETQVAWIIPPAWTFDVRLQVPVFDDIFPLLEKEDGLTDFDGNRNSFRRSANAITIGAALFDSWMDNRFGIDIDDDYRIVIFQDLPEGVSLGPRLPMDQAMTPQQLVYLRIHFTWCLCVNITGGDIRLDYPDGGCQLMDDALEYGICDLDRKYKTRIGREVKSVYYEGGPPRQCATGEYGTPDQTGCGCTP